MSRIEPGKRPSEPQAPGGIRESDKAVQQPSGGPELGKAMNLFLGFVWIISFAWTKSSFGDWTSKKRLTSSLSNKIADAAKDVSPAKKETLQKYYETHLEALSLEELQNLETRFEKAPGTAANIHTFNLKSPQNLPEKLRTEVAVVAEEKAEFKRIVTSLADEIVKVADLASK